MRIPVVALSIAALVTAPVAGGQAPDTVFHSVVFSGKTMAGTQKTWRDKDGIHIAYEYNDRGRGPKVVQDVRLAPNGLPVAVAVRGNNYLKNTVDEKFSMENGVATWQSAAERGSRSGQQGFYVTFDGAPEEYAILVNALNNAPTKRVALFPAGEATVTNAGERSLSSNGQSLRVTQYLISGFGYTPQPVWLDQNGELFAVGATWSMTIRKGWESFVSEIAAAQDSVASLLSVKVARELRRKPSGPVVFRNARLFDADAGVMQNDMSVVVSGNHITAVGSSAKVKTPAGAEVIDVHGKTLMPGLWDMHVHIDDTDGLQNIAAGVTTVRDLANDTDELIQRRKRFDDGTLVGPRIFMAGIIDGKGPMAGPTKVLIDNEAEARAAVNNYADLGYVQIKVYSSVKPELVPAIIDQAHKRGLRVSGHVPAFMIAEQFVKDGADEMQHMNFVFLNFWGDSIKDTRTPLRFTAVAERASSLDLSSQPVRDFIALLKQRHVVVDPTLNIFESFFQARPGTIMPGYETVAERLPSVVRRGLLGGGLPVPEGKDSLYLSAFPPMLKMLKMLYDAGVTIVAGTDAAAGFALHRELELYSRAGIPNAQVLRIATIGAATVMGKQSSMGSIKVGKLADLIIVDGDPVKNISDIRRVEMTMKDGALFESAKVYRSLGVKPVQ